MRPVAESLDESDGMVTPGKKPEISAHPPDRLQKTVGPERAALGMLFLQSDFYADGRLKISVGKRETLTDDSEWTHLFMTVGLPARHEPRMSLRLRCHVSLGIAFESAAVAAVQRGKGAS
ncbi:hypothetical protein [Gluconacetobacter sacchari]|uniref:hypothetical protein n=1 Tax=Gluconacetobacter sacchari TaxID=92759 RepID=UPI0039B4ECC4